MSQQGNSITVSSEISPFSNSGGIVHITRHWLHTYIYYNTLYYTYDFVEKLYLKSVIIGGNCRVNPGVRVSNWTVGSEFK